MLLVRPRALIITRKKLGQLNMVVLICILPLCVQDFDPTVHFIHCARNQYVHPNGSIDFKAFLECFRFHDRVRANEGNAFAVSLVFAGGTIPMQDTDYQRTPIKSTMTSPHGATTHTTALRAST